METTNIKDVKYFQSLFEVQKKEAKASEGDDEPLKIKGLASTPTIDRYEDIVEPGAFKKSIRNEYKKNPIILLQHNPERPIGKAIDMRVTPEGLNIVALIYDEETKKNIKNEILRAFSIGFRVKKYYFKDSNGNVLDPAKDNVWAKGVLRVISEVDLVENSIVSVPANPDALFTATKSATKFFNELKSLTNNDMGKNLLDEKEVKDDETSADDTAGESVETDAEKPEGDETSAEETESEESVETDAEADKGEDSDAEGADENSDNESESEDESAGDEAGESEGAEQGDDAKAFDGYDDDEVKTLEKMATPEGAVVAYEAIKKLKGLLANIPEKQALAFGLNPADTGKGETLAEVKASKKGFKDMFENSAN